MVKFVSATIVVASVALLAVACGGGSTSASRTTATAPRPQSKPTPSWTAIGGICLNTLRSTVVRKRGHGVKFGDAYDYSVAGHSVLVFFEHGRVVSLRTWDPIVALPDGVRIGAGSMRFPTDWRSMGSGVRWKGYIQESPEHGLEHSGTWRKIVRQRDGSGVLVAVDIDGPHAEPAMIGLTWLAPGYKVADLMPEAMPENQSVAQPRAPSAELERLGELHACGILTDEEFQQAKRRVLESLRA